MKKYLTKLLKNSNPTKKAADSPKKFNIIGYYDYTVVLTYISLAVSITGMFLALSMHLKLAVTCLALSGLCDMFDGKIARSKKDRTEDEKNFGIQIDSLCDIVCFGVLPVIICYMSGVRSALGVCLLIMYCLCGLIRLAYFNVMEQNRTKETSDARKYYQGLPITSMSVVLPFVFLIGIIFPKTFVILLHITLLVVGLMFIINFRFRKPTNKELVFLVSIVCIVMIVVLSWRHHKAAKFAAECLDVLFKGAVCNI